MKMFIYEKSVFTPGGKPLEKYLEFDSKCACDRHFFINEIESWFILFKYYIKPKVKAHKKGTRIVVKIAFEF